MRPTRMSGEKKSQFAKLANEHGIVLLYHSVSPESRCVPSRTIHHIRPEVLDRHIADLSEFFRFVTLKEFARQENPVGLAALTFDDGYRDALEHAGPVLSQRRLDACMFLNAVTLQGHLNWRDKVRYIIQCNREQEFLEYYPLAGTSKRFYRNSKHPANNSAELNHAMDRFLAGSVCTLYPEFPYLRQDEIAGNSSNHLPFQFGNHGFNHYVLSSLSDEQQRDEIHNPAEMLSSLSCNFVESIFSVPFGGDTDINRATVENVRRSGYTSMLMSRQRLQTRFDRRSSVRLIERFMPRTDDILSEILDTCFSSS